jgi:hypothetical protein
MWYRTCFLAVVLWAGALAGAQGQSNRDDVVDQGARYAALLDNVDLLIDNYSRYLGTKYGLNGEQDAYTKQMLREKTYGFLERHEDHLRDVVETMFSVRTGAEMSADELQAWGKSVLPIYEDAKKMIQDGNADWRGILTEEQKKLHDEDLQLMERSLSTTEDQLQRIVTGDMTVDEFRNPRRYRNRNPPPPPAHDAADGAPTALSDGPGVNEVIPPRPEGPRRGIVRPDEMPASPPGEPPLVVADLPTEQQAEVLGEGAPAEGEGAMPAEGEEAVAEEHAGQPQPPEGDGVPQAEQPPAQETPPPGPQRPQRGGKSPAAGPDFEGQWDQYVKDFIARYQLDDQQSQQANTILEDCKAQGRKVVQSRKSLLDQLEQRSKELREQQARDGGKKRGEELAQLERKKQGVFEPLSQIFEGSLKPRLEKLPTRAQRKAADEKNAKPQGGRKPAGAAESGSGERNRERPKKPEGAP